MRKKVKILTFVILLFGLTNQTQASNIRADVDQLNGINTTDALLVLRKSLGLDMSATKWRDSNTTADVNCDKISDLNDVRLILRDSLDLDMSGTGWCEVDILAITDWKIFSVTPSASRNDDGTAFGKSHSRYLVDFKLMVDELTLRGINVIHFHMPYDNFRNTVTDELNNPAVWDLARGFTFAEVQEMAQYVHSKGMFVMIGLSTLTGQQSTGLSKAHPEIMLPEIPWKTGITCRAGDYVVHNNKFYKAIATHTASTDKEPGVSATWSKHWRQRVGAHLRDPFNKRGEQILFDMVDEVIMAFTVNSIKPVAFHMGGDEGRFWDDKIKCPTNCDGLTAAESFALPFNNLAKHLQINHPEVRPMMWGDMLVEHWNGGEYNTADALNTLDSNIIIADWQYQKRSFLGYDFHTKQFNSLKIYADKGFTVVGASWDKPEATKDLIWTTNRLRQDGFPVAGHIYTTWAIDTEYDVARVLKDPNATVLSEHNRGLAISVDKTSHLINIKSCRQDITNCGTYPNCTSPVEMSGMYDGSYREYICDNGKVSYTIKDLPIGVSHWKFDGDTQDSFGSNHGTLAGDANITNDSVRGKVLGLNGNGYFTAPDNDTLDMTSTMSVSLWFKLAKIPPENTRNALLTKNGQEYQFLIADDGELYAYTSDGEGRFEVGIRQEVLNTEWSLKWTHFAYTLDGINEKIYINGKLVKTSNPPKSIKSFAGTKVGDHNLNIGGRDTGHFYFDGLIDDAMIYDTALDGSDIRAIYYKQKR